MKKVILLAMCLLLVVAVALTGVLVVGINRGGNGGGWSFNIARAELANRQVFSAAAIDTVDVSYSSETIILEHSGSDEIILEEYMSRWDDDMLASTTESGGTLKIRQGRRGFEFMWFSEVKVYLPKDWNGELIVNSSSGGIHSEEDFSLQSLTANSSSGSVRFADVAAEGDITLNASSGSVSFGTITASGDVDLQTSSGSVRGDDITAANVLCNASSGSVHAGDIKAETLAAETSSGSIHFERVDAIFITSTSGSARLTTSDDAAFFFEARTNSGSIHTPFDNALTFERGDKEASGSVGRQPEYTVSASSGSVHVEWI